MKPFLFAPLALAALLVGTMAATAAPAEFGYGPHYRPTPRERARFEARHRRPAPRPEWHRPLPPPRPLPPTHHAAPRYYR